jgi:cardiolipin synthase
VCIENAYFLPDRPVRRALARAVRRGVSVEVIVPGASDIKAVQYAGLWAMRAVAKAGVKVRRWKGIMLHAKIAVIDGVWSVVGSYNFDAQSLLQNLEVVAEIVGPEFGAIVQAQFDDDIANSDPFDEAAWQRLPWWKKLVSRLAFAFRGWL